MPVTNIGSTWNASGLEGDLTFYDKIGGGNVLTIARDMAYLNDQRYAVTYYVDGNTTNTTLDGKTWATAFDSIADGLAAADDFMGLAANRAWAKRARVYVVGDALEEDLTALAEKTDVIGLGQCDGFFGARIKGNHVIGSTSYAGCRLFNLSFLDADAGGVILTIPTQQSGIELHGCTFLPANVSSTPTTVGLLVTASAYFRAYNCEFAGEWDSGFSTAAISLGAGTGHGTVIDNCRISNTHATGLGITVNASRAGSNSWISNNFLKTVGGIPVDDNSDTFMVVNNRWITNIDCATYTAGFDINLLLASGNLQTGGNAGDHDSVPHILFA